MRLFQPLDDVLGSRAKVRVLRALWQADEALSGREVARRSGLSHTGALKALEELYRQDVLGLSSDATGIRYRLDPRHELVSLGIVPLLELESSLEHKLVQAILEAVPQALSVVLFGSAARRDEQPESDADALIVVPDDIDPHAAFDAVAGLDTRARFGKDVGPVVWTHSTLLVRHETNHPLLAAILRDGRLVAGEAPQRLIWDRLGAA